MVSGCREDIDEEYTWTKNQDQGLTNAHQSQSRPTVAKAKPPVPGITALDHKLAWPPCTRDVAVPTPTASMLGYNLIWM